MPVGEKCTFRQTYQFVLVRLGPGVLRLTTKWASRPAERAAHPAGGRKPSRAFGIERVEGGYRLVYVWRPDGPVHLELFDSIEAATDDYAAWLEEAFDVQPRGVAFPFCGQCARRSRAIARGGVAMLRANASNCARFWEFMTWCN